MTPKLDRLHVSFNFPQAASMPLFFFFFSPFLCQPLMYWSPRVIFSSQCTSLKCLALKKSKWPLRRRMYLAPSTVDFILTPCPVCVQPPADSLLLSRPFFAATVVTLVLSKSVGLWLIIIQSVSANSLFVFCNQLVFFFNGTYCNFQPVFSAPGFLHWWWPLLAKPAL